MTYKKPEQQLQYSAFAAYYKHEQDAQYPYLLALSIQRTKEQFELARAMKMLGDWVTEYEHMSQIIKYKYSTYIPKIQKILFTRFQQQAPIEYCLARFLVCFYNTWKELTAALVEELNQCDNYALSFLWYTCHNLVEDMNLQKQQSFLEYLTTNYQVPLRHFQPQTQIEARRVLGVAYLLNVHGLQQKFIKNADLWADKMLLFQEASGGDTTIELLVDILRNRSLLLQGQRSRNYWMSRINFFLDLLEKRVPTMKIENTIDKNLLDTFTWIVELPEPRSILRGSQGRYIKTLLVGTRPDPNKPNHPFHHPKYQQLRNVLYQLFFYSDPAQTQARLKDILQKFSTHAFSIFNDESNYCFLDCLTEKEIKLETNLIVDILKILSNSHIRRTLAAKILLVLAKTVTAALDSCQFSEQNIGMCLKAFNDCLIYKITDPLINELRDTIARLFLAIMKKYTWEDTNKSETIFNLCEEYEKNSKNTDPIVLHMLCNLVKRFGFAQNNLHKLEPLISEIHLKVIYDQENIHPFISLMIGIYYSTKWQKAPVYINSVCTKNPSKLAPFFAFQVQILIKSNDSSSEEELNSISELLKDREQWSENRIQVNLMQLEMFFIKLSVSDGFEVLKKVDSKLLDLFGSFYQEKNYHLLSSLAAKTLPAAGNQFNLQKLASYQWIRKYSFQILARSFYKTTSIYVCCIFSNIILRSDNPLQTIKWLSKDQFLEYLYQGLNDFLSKQKKYPLEVASSILTFKLFKVDPHIIPQQSKIPQFATLYKNVDWWDDANNTVTFPPLNDNEESNAWLLPEFRSYYQEAMIEYIRGYLKGYEEKKARRQYELRLKLQRQEDLDV